MEIVSIWKFVPHKKTQHLSQMSYKEPSFSSHYIPVRYMTRDSDLVCTSNKSLTIKKPPFDSLPSEIIKEILCNVDSEFLPDMKLVCTRWRKMITEILTLEQDNVSDTVSIDALNIFEQWVKRSNGYSYFSAHKATYSVLNIISKPTLDKLLNTYVYKLNEVDYITVLRTLEYHARNGGAYTSGCEDVIGSVWRTVLAITSVPESVERLRGLKFEDDAVKSFMTKYTWYTYMCLGMPNMSWSVGIIALYPDNKRFIVLLAYDFD